MPIHIIEPTTYECFNCGNTWTKEQLEELGCLAPDHTYECPSCGEDSPICVVGSEEWHELAREEIYQQAIRAEVQSERKVAKAYPALFDSELYEREMRDAGRA